MTNTEHMPFNDIHNAGLTMFRQLPQHPVNGCAHRARCTVQLIGTSMCKVACSHITSHTRYGSSDLAVAQASHTSVQLSSG